MSQDPLFILVILSMAVVLIVLMIGIGGFGRGGEFNRKYANKLVFEKMDCEIGHFFPMPKVSAVKDSCTCIPLT